MFIAINRGNNIFVADAQELHIIIVVAVIIIDCVIFEFSKFST